MVVGGGRGPLVAAGVGEVVPGSQLVRLWRPTGPVHVLDKKKQLAFYIYTSKNSQTMPRKAQKNTKTRKKGVLLKQKLYTVEKNTTVRYKLN